ncbi:MAG: Gx transporter family protein [Clostridia bacterium]|nr:Gx transporter family protein [Clostridia bacterium]
MKTKNITKQVALTGVLSAQALALSFLESLIPVAAGFPPGAKPGFSNVVVMFAAGTVGIPQTFAIMLIKAIFAGLTRGFTAFFMSLAGGLLSTTMALILMRSQKIKLGYIGVGIACAVCHNIGQLSVASVISGTPKLFVSYGPFLLLASILTGFLTGTVLKYTMPALEKQCRFILKTNINKELNK